MKTLIIIGAGGNSKVIVDLIQSRIQAGEALHILGFLDDDRSKTELEGFPSLGGVREIEKFRDEPGVYFINGIGDNATRKKLDEQYPGVRYYTAVHQSALIGRGVSLGAGAVVMAGAIINAGAVVGRQALINTGAIVEHDNVIGDFAHIASGAVTAGGVRVGELSLLGTGSRVIQGIEIGRNTVIGAGAAVISHIPEDCVAVGVPARVKRKRG
jgi:sugar O-acyltransferase (sialic acid O-acetyltransferase NeuD family)